MVSGAQMRRWYCQQSPRHRPAYCRSTAFFLEQKQGGLAACNTLASKTRQPSRRATRGGILSGRTPAHARRVVSRPLGSGRWLVALALAAIFTASRDPEAAPGPDGAPRATARTKQAPAPSRRGTNSEQRAALPTPRWPACRTSTRPSPRYLPCRRAPSPSRGCSTTPCRVSRKESPNLEDGATGAPSGAAVPLTSTATPRTTPGESSREERKGRKGRLWILPK